MWPASWLAPSPTRCLFYPLLACAVLIREPQLLSHSLRHQVEWELASVFSHGQPESLRYSLFGRISQAPYARMIWSHSKCNRVGYILSTNKSNSPAIFYWKTAYLPPSRNTGAIIILFLVGSNVHLVDGKARDIDWLRHARKQRCL